MTSDVSAYERQFRRAGLPLFVGGVLRLDRRLQPGSAAARRDRARRAARRGTARLELVAEPARAARRARRRDRWNRGDQRRPEAPDQRDAEAAREDGARRVRGPPGAAAADLRRSAGQRGGDGDDQPGDPRGDLRGLRLRAPGDPALGPRPARGSARLVARPVREGRAAAGDLRAAVLHDRGDLGHLRPHERRRLRRRDRPVRRFRVGVPHRPHPARDAPPRARGGRRRAAAAPGAADQCRARPVRQPGGPGAVRRPHDRALLRRLRDAGCRRGPAHGVDEHRGHGPGLGHHRGRELPAHGGAAAGRRWLGCFLGVLFCSGDADRHDLSRGVLDRAHGRDGRQLQGAIRVPAPAWRQLRDEVL